MKRSGIGGILGQGFEIGVSGLIHGALATGQHGPLNGGGSDLHGEEDPAVLEAF
jgi:hypothetical protein